MNSLTLQDGFTLTFPLEDCKLLDRILVGYDVLVNFINFILSNTLFI